jgi:RHS repeat-associated protein
MILSYDCENNLHCVSNALSGTVSLYWYDSAGRRIAKSESDLLTLYIWDGMDIIATANADGSVREYFTRGVGIAGDVGSLVAETRFENGVPVSTTYLHSNWRGDVVMATTENGTVIGSYDYTTFGEQLSAVGTYTPRFTFSSKERDASGLVYYGFRYYSPVLCRWINEDPIRESGGINLYQFCGNNPVNGIDTDGRVWGYAVAAAVAVGVGTAYLADPWIEVKGDPGGGFAAQTRGPFTFYGPEFKELPLVLQEATRYHESHHKYHQWKYWPWDILGREIDAYKSERKWLADRLNKPGSCNKDRDIINERIQTIDDLLRNDAAGLREIYRGGK